MMKLPLKSLSLPVALLLVTGACATVILPTRPATTAAPATLTARQNAFLDTLQQRTFAWFWERTDSTTGLTPDRWPTKSFSSVAAIGFALTAYPVGIERGYVSRSAAAQRTLN
ncbi:MAG TPA: hypothetical protein VNJ04_07175, partial [Gemmatimonadaceae bacterium]|nr:hypothetical protein [Gemmatimonadaceae bacterium]